MQFGDDFDLVAYRLADLAERIQAPLEVGGGDVLAAGTLGVLVEGPDFHRHDPFGEQVLGQRPGVGEEPFEDLTAQNELGLSRLATGGSTNCSLAGPVSRVTRARRSARASVVDRDRLSGQTPQQLVER